MPFRAIESCGSGLPSSELVTTPVTVRGWANAPATHAATIATSNTILLMLAIGLF